MREAVTHHPGPCTYVACYRTLLSALDRRYDIRGSLLSEMVILCLANHGKLPPIRRAYYQRRAQAEAIDYLEHLTARLLYGPGGLLGRRREQVL